MVQKISIAFINYVICLFVIAIKLPVCYGRKPERTVKVLQEKNRTSFYFNEKVSLRLFVNKTTIVDMLMCCTALFWVFTMRITKLT